MSDFWDFQQPPSYVSDTPQSYALLKGWNQDMARWTQAQRGEYLEWATAAPDSASIATTGDAFANFNPPAENVDTLSQWSGRTYVDDTLTGMWADNTPTVSTRVPPYGPDDPSIFGGEAPSIPPAQAPQGMGEFFDAPSAPSTQAQIGRATF